MTTAWKDIMVHPTYITNLVQGSVRNLTPGQVTMVVSLLREKWARNVRTCVWHEASLVMQSKCCCRNCEVPEPSYKRLTIVRQVRL